MTESVSDMILPGGCRIIRFPENRDDRGALSFAEGLEHIPFRIDRVFWIYGVPEGKTRGDHSHCESAEVVVPVSGSFDMYVSDGSCECIVRMDSPSCGILIPPGVWCALRNFSPETVCVVFASHPYNASGYTDNYEGYAGNCLTVHRYSTEQRDEWNSFVKSSKNGTFLLDRNYMDYHSDRFNDCSLMLYRKGGLVALLPANYERETGTVHSHAGLTYGGLVLAKDVTASDVLEMFNAAMGWMRNSLGAVRFVYKPVPYIYSSLPSEEDLYAVFRNNGRLLNRAVSSVIGCGDRLPFCKLRKRGMAKAAKNGLSVREGTSETDWAGFWVVLSEVLMKRHGREPVHSLDEIKLLASRFPENIRLYVVTDSTGNIVAGTVMYVTDNVAHSQYIAASEQGRGYGALDLLFSKLITDVFAAHRYFDFGISTEQGGRFLNEGLMFQKEGFGARAVVYDTYEIMIE